MRPFCSDPFELRRAAVESGYYEATTPSESDGSGPLLDFAKTFGPRPEPEGGQKFLYSTRRVWRVMSLVAPVAVADAVSRNDMDYLGSELPWAVRVEVDLTVADVLRLNRDYYEGSRFDLTKGLAAGPWGDPTRADIAYVGGDAVYPPAEPDLPSRRDAADVGRFERAISLFRTTYSTVVHAGGHSRPNVLWFGPGAPHATVYVPLVVDESLAAAPTPHSRGSLFEQSDASLWWTVTLIANWIRTAGFKFAILDVRAAQAALEKSFAETVYSLDAKNYDAQRTNDDMARLAHDTWHRLFKKLVTKFRDDFVLLGDRPTEVHVTKLFYPQTWLEQVGYFSPIRDYDPPPPDFAVVDVGDADVLVPPLEGPVAVNGRGEPGAEDEAFYGPSNWLLIPSMILLVAAALYGRALDNLALDDPSERLSR